MDLFIHILGDHNSTNTPYIYKMEPQHQLQLQQQQQLLHGLLQTLLRNKVLRKVVLQHVHQIHVVLMKAASLPLTRIMRGDMFEKERCLSTMLRYGRSDLFIKYFDFYVLARPGKDIPLSLGHLIRRAIKANQINAVGMLFKLHRDNYYNNNNDGKYDNNAVFNVVFKQIHRVVQRDHLEMFELLLSEMDNNHMYKPLCESIKGQITIGSLYAQCRSFKMLQTLHSQRYRFNIDSGKEIAINIQLVKTLKCDQLPDLFKVLTTGGSTSRFNYSFLTHDILVQHHNDYTLLDRFFNLHSASTLARSLETNLLLAPRRGGDNTNEDLYTFTQSSAGQLPVVQRYRQHLPIDFVCLAAATFGDIGLAQWATSRKEAPILGIHVAEALRRGFIDVALHLLDNCKAHEAGPRCIWTLNGPINESILTMELLRTLASYNNIKIYTGILFSPTITIEMIEFISGSNNFCNFNARYPNLLKVPEIMMVKDITVFKQLIQRCINDPTLFKFEELVANAVVRARHDVLAMISEFGNLIRIDLGVLNMLETKEQVLYVLSSGLLAQPTATTSSLSIENIVRKFNDVSLVRDIQREFGPVVTFSVVALDEAVRRGNLELVRFLNENLREGHSCSSLALENAAINGHLEVLREDT
ncbi:hypothetical protein SAMD00019534_074270 [Acytostelium subglobosum LB1]|uniref:hypothetical protein n=1 Tax=Acytostelium subglobosum LB1 TaxID=1410327 RepID=UPI000644AE23|nr:hypothetical protein SAMD00019534_074270 [Acytostelium subglobosum LB1]GAM24252.1 hypothetical protein SAMD00019534_074270 [Acytostelium subglobosum LB1]|eukprot:XP_012752578.1 hypothetical protein SAMD00019534_074270 [Acytostelium subglobosum LB1]